jgi:MFS family permease
MTNVPGSHAETARPAGPVLRRVTAIRTFQALENDAFRTLWYGMLASYLAMQMSLIARGYLAFHISGSATALGLVTMARGLPQLVLSPFGGVAADRFDKRRLLIATQIGMSITAIVTAALVVLGVIAIWQMVIIGLVEGTIWAFNMPPRQAIVPELVDDDALMNAIAINNAGLNFTRIAGPALAGLLMSIAWVGAGGVFILVALSYTGFILALTRLPRGRAVPPKTAGSVLEQVASGFSYTWRNRPVFLLMLLAFVPIVFGMAYQTLLPVFQKDVLNVGASELGLLFASSGLGALVGSLALASLSGVRRKDALQIGFGVAFGAALVLFALSGSYPLSLALLLLVGLAGNAYTALNSTLIMTATDRAYHGRVMSIYMMTWSLSPLASLPIGMLVDAFGAPATVAVFGVIVTVVIAAAGPLRLRWAIRPPAPAVEAAPRAAR